MERPFDRTWLGGRSPWWLGGLLSAALMLSGCTTGSDEQVTAPVASLGTGAPAVPRQWLVTVGDSYISGEGARWAGNTSGAADAVDALGPRAYLDADGHEAEPGCHRARWSEADFGGRLRGMNLSCSGATTRSTGHGRRSTPGLDFARETGGHVGQALALQRFASRHDVADVVVSIGGNDAGFSTVIGRCLTDFVTTVASEPVHCSDDAQLATMLRRPSTARLAAEISAALRRVSRAMRRAGYASGDYRLVVQTYPSPLPPGPRIRYAENQLERSVVGGCPWYDEDARWADRVVVPAINLAVTEAVRMSRLTDVSVLDLSRALVGHRLCERGVDLLTATRLRDWRDAGAVDRLEWVNAVYVKGAPWQVQESLHPNYWGTAALGSCLRQLLAAPTTASARCAPSRSGSRGGLPRMTVRTG